MNSIELLISATKCNIAQATVLAGLLSLDKDSRFYPTNRMVVKEFPPLVAINMIAAKDSISKSEATIIVDNLLKELS